MANRKNENRPVVPEDTCPYIDMVQNIVDKMSSQNDESFRRDQAVLANALLEYIRESNLRLRMSSKHWYDRRRR